MLPLDSERWAELKASSGNSGALAARLLREIRDGTAANWVELYHQACHQFSVGEVAYAVVPHVLDIAESLPMRDRREPLVIAGTVAACIANRPKRVPPISEDLRRHYQATASTALELALEALRDRSWRPGEVIDLLAVVAALQGRHNLAIHLFLHGGSDDELECPECGEFIRYDG